MHDRYFETADKLQSFYAEKAAGIPLGRIATVAGAVAFLCSDLAADITGTEVVVDCGESLCHG
jgi:NAD(P)-dependent dehydrogenase (short-subunit alcohol dehydrogenase family)